MIKINKNQACEITELGSLRQEDYEFKDSLGYIISQSPAWATQQDFQKKKEKEKNK